MTPLQSWGRLGAPRHELVVLSERGRVADALAAHRPGIAFGMGRSYGDACLNPGGVAWLTPALDRCIAFDPQQGVLDCEAGVLLRDIQRLMIPRGWSLPVTPGTQWVTVGGAIAHDVHGKNHHRHGSFGDHVLELTLLRTDGQTLVCGPTQQAHWYAATLGGAGLTGVITQARLQLVPCPGPWLDTDTTPFDGLDAFFEMADRSQEGWEHTVAWIDCLSGRAGRGVFMRSNAVDGGGRREPRERLRTMPLVPPVSLVNRLTLRPFNALYQRLKGRPRRAVAHREAFLYPLDGLQHWNRMYGPAGFYQHQCVVPRAQGREAIGELLDAIARAGAGSFLAVLKTFGERASAGLLGFPRPGVTLALDFPNQGARTRTLLARLDAIVEAAGGAVYLAKDASMSRQTFQRGYPRWAEMLPYRDPGVRSGLSRRLFGDPE